MKTYQKIIIALVICAVGFGAFQWLKKGKEEIVIPPREPTPVEAVAARAGEILRRVNAVGNLTAIQSVTLHSEVSGKIAKIYFKEGERVKENEPLFKIDDVPYKAAYKEAQADLALKKEEYNRATKLLEKTFGTVQARDKAFAELQVAEAKLDKVKGELDSTVIKAPFEGIMGLKKISVGAFITHQDELGNLVDLDPINVDFNLPESFLPFVHVGDTVDVTIEDYDILPVDATIKAISPEIDEATRTVVMRAQMPNTNLVYRPGEFARVMVLAGKIENAVLVPETAIEREGEEEFVKLVENNVAIRTTVSTGMRDGNDVEITHGLKANDLVIVAGQFKVHDGDEVVVVNEKSPQKKEKSLQ